MSRPNVFGADAAEHDPFEPHVGWRGGIAAGLVAAVAMGVGITVVEPALLRTEIAGLYGAAGSLAAGWLVHLAHGAVFGLVFALVAADPTLANVSHRYPGSVVAGAVYGVVLAVVGMGILMPMWLDAAGLAPPAIPYVTTSLFAWHLVYGLFLGLAFPRLDGW
jgi:hypothetical protein